MRDTTTVLRRENVLKRPKGLKTVLGGSTPLMLYVFSLASLITLLGSSNAFIVTVITDMLTWMGLASSLNIIMGFAGYVSFGHVVFMGIGGYMLALTLEYWLPGLASSLPVAAAVVGVVLGSLVSALLAGAVGAIVLRLRGVFFAIATIGLDLAVMYLFYMLPTLEGGGEIYISSVHIAGLRTVALTVWIIYMATILVMIMVKRSKLGIGLTALREDEDAAESLGVPTFRYKTIAFMLSAALTGAMGAAYVWRTMSVTPGDAFDLVYSIRMIVINVIGGLGTLLGPIVGGAIYYILYLLFTTSHGLTELADIIMGLLAIAFVLFLPKGIVGWLRSKRLSMGGAGVNTIIE